MKLFHSCKGTRKWTSPSATECKQLHQSSLGISAHSRHMFSYDVISAENIQPSRHIYLYTTWSRVFV